MWICWNLLATHLSVGNIVWSVDFWRRYDEVFFIKRLPSCWSLHIFCHIPHHVRSKATNGDISDVCCWSIHQTCRDLGVARLAQDQLHPFHSWSFAGFLTVWIVWFGHKSHWETWTKCANRNMHGFCRLLYITSFLHWFGRVAFWSTVCFRR